MGIEEACGKADVLACSTEYLATREALEDVIAVYRNILNMSFLAYSKLTRKEVEDELTTLLSLRTVLKTVDELEDMTYNLQQLKEAALRDSDWGTATTIQMEIDIIQDHINAETRFGSCGVPSCESSSLSLSSSHSLSSSSSFTTMPSQAKCFFKFRK